MRASTSVIEATGRGVGWGAAMVVRPNRSQCVLIMDQPDNNPQEWKDQPSSAECPAIPGQSTILRALILGRSDSAIPDTPPAPRISSCYPATARHGKWCVGMYTTI